MPTRDPSSKLQHIDACLTDAVEYDKSAGFERFSFANNALCEVSLSDIDLSTSLMGKRLNAPLMISPMTGGVERAHTLNQRLARAAEKWGLVMGVGSQRVGLEDQSRAGWFGVRDAAPTAFIFANIGGVQLVKGWGVEEAQRAVDMIDADALFLHLNPMQEAIQGGDQDFRGLTERIREVASALSVPVFVREVGFGISRDVASALVEAGVAGIDCAGAGGTSWAKVEGIVAKSERRRVMGAIFGEWGIPTTRSIVECREAAPDLPLIACGGLRSGVDVAKSLALGANIGSMARPFLLAAEKDDVDGFIEQTLEELRICMFGVGAEDVEGLRAIALVER